MQPGKSQTWQRVFDMRAAIPAFLVLLGIGALELIDRRIPGGLNNANGDAVACAALETAAEWLNRLSPKSEPALWDEVRQCRHREVRKRHRSHRHRHSVRRDVVWTQPRYQAPTVSSRVIYTYIPEGHLESRSARGESITLRRSGQTRGRYQPDRFVYTLRESLVDLKDNAANNRDRELPRRR